jgi:NADH dehydrogenase
MSTILLTGASGFVGSHVLPAILDAGHRVVALTRTPKSGETVLRRLSADQRGLVDLRHGDVTDPSTLPSALEGVDAVVHLVAIPRDFDRGASLRLVNTEGTRNLVQAARGAGVRRFVHQGAMGVEDDPALHYSSSKARAERIVADSDLDWTILRPSILWGERDGFFNIIAGLVRWSPGLVPVPGSGNARFQPLWIADLARVVVAAIGDPGATVGRSLDLGGPRYWTYREITREVMRAIGRRGIIVPMPVPLISVVAGAAELTRLPFPVATDQLRQLRLDNVGPLDTIEREFGFAPADMAGRLGHVKQRMRDQEPADASVGLPPASA